MARKGKINIGAEVNVTAKEDGSLSKIEKRIEDLSNAEIKVKIGEVENAIKELEKLKSKLGKKAPPITDITLKDLENQLTVLKEAEKKTEQLVVAQEKIAIATEKNKQKVIDETIIKTKEQTAAIQQQTKETEQLAKTRKKVSSIKVREFTQEEYDSMQEKYQQENNGTVESLENTVDIIRKASQFGTQFAADMTTSCKRAATAVNRFFSAIDPNKYPAIASWKDSILESVQNGDFSGIEKYNGMFTGSYSWGVDEIGDGYYVYLNLLDIAKDKEKEYSAYLDEEFRKRDEGLEKQNELTRKLIQSYEKLDKLHANEPNWDKNNTVESIKKRLEYYEQEKALLQDIQNLKLEFTSISPRYTDHTRFNETARCFQNTLRLGSYGNGTLADNERSITIYQSELESAIKKQEKLTSAMQETAQAREKEVTEQEKLAATSKNIIQLVDNYGAKLDDVNNKLMQGTTLLNKKAQVLRLFHNSSNIFDAFDSTKAGSNQGQALGFGHYLALQQNGEFNNADYGRYQTQWYANVRNAFKVGDKISSDQAASIIDKFLANRAEGFKQHMLSKLLDGDVVDAVKDIADESKTVVGEIFNHVGYDAIMDGAQINVFDPSKIYRANDSVLDISTKEFVALEELQKKIWEEQKVIENANRQIRDLSNQYIGKTEDELDLNLFMETSHKGFGWRQNVAKIASAFKELTGKLPKSDHISEESMQAMVENYEFSKQNLQEYQEAVAEHQSVVNELTAQFNSQKAVIDTITQSYLTGDIKGIVNAKTQTESIASATQQEQQFQKKIEETTGEIQNQNEALKDDLQQRLVGLKDFTDGELQILLNDIDLDKTFKGLNIANDEIDSLKQKFIDLLKITRNYESEFADEDRYTIFENLIDDVIRLGSETKYVEKTYEDFRKYMVGTKVFYNDTIKSEFGTYGRLEWKDFYKRNQKYLSTSSKNAIPADTLMTKLVDQFGGLFSREDLSKPIQDQFIKIMDVWEKARREFGQKSQDIFALDRRDMENYFSEIFVRGVSNLAKLQAIQEKQVASEQELADAAERTVEAERRKGAETQETTENTQAQINAEKQLNRAIEEGTNSRRNALQILRDADKITKTGYKFDEVFNFTDLENKLTNFVQQISNDPNLKIGKVSVAEYTDDGAIGWISYYNNETKKALEQTFELKDGILQLGKMRFSQDFKALDAQALAQAKKDFNDLISLTKKLNEADLGFYKAQNLGIDTSSYIANMESYAQRITEIHNRLTLSAEQETELTRINNQHLLAKAKLLEGIASKEQKVQDVVATQEKKMQENIANITQRVNESMKQWASDGSFNNIFPPELQNQINQFKASLSNLGKETNFAQLNQAWDQITQKTKEATKAAQEYKNASYKNQFQNEYKYNNGKTVQDQVVLDSYADYYKKEEEKAQQFSNNIRSIYDRLMSTMKEFNNVSTKLNNVTLQDKGSGLYQKQIQNLQDQKSSLFADLRSLSGEMEEALSLKLPSGSAGFTAFFQDARVQTELGTEAVKKFIDTLKQMENINFDFASKLSAQVQPVIEKIQSLEQMIKSGFIDKNSDIAKNILNFDSILSGKLNSFNESHSAYDAQDVMRYAEQISEVISLYEKAAKAEQQYFAGKQKYTANTSMQTMAEDAKKAAEEVSGAQQKLTTAAQKFAEKSGASGAILTNFVQGVDGIARLDFSVFDSGTNSLRKFRMEMGSVSDGTYITETTVNNFVSKTQQAAKQLQTVSDLIGRLQFSGANMDNSSVVRLVELQGKLATELSKGSGANQNVLSQLTKDAKLSTAEVEKLYKQFIQLENLVGSGDAIDLGKINFSGDITQQLKDSLAAWGEEKNFTNIKLTGLNEATGKFKVTAEGADNTVRTFTGNLNKLGQSASMQQTNVTELSSKWDKFKASLSKTGKQLMTALVGYNVFFKVISEIRKGINYVKDIDLAMTELKKVTDESEASYNRFLETASKSASIVGSTVSSFTEATANFARLGYSIDESTKMAETAIVYKNVADGLDTVDEATESIISTMKAFGIESSDTMGIIDRFNEVGNNFAITSAGIGEALQRSASALAEAGNSIDESIALVTAAMKIGCLYRNV